MVGIQKTRKRTNRYKRADSIAFVWSRPGEGEARSEKKGGSALEEAKTSMARGGRMNPSLSEEGGVTPNAWGKGAYFQRKKTKTKDGRGGEEM